MKMSFFWALVALIDLVDFVADVFKNHLTVSSWLDLPAILCCLWLAHAAYKREVQRARAKKALLLTFMNTIDDPKQFEQVARIASKLEAGL